MPSRPRHRRRLAFALVASVALLLPSVALALPVPPTVNWRASAPGTDPTEWNATVGSHQWSVSGATQTTPTSAYPGITGSFDMAAGDSVTGVSFQTITGGNPSDENVSLELWFRPDSLADGEQVLFETGGNRDGLSLLLNDDVLTVRVKDNNDIAETSYTLTDATEFTQAAITVDLNGNANLYVNGLLRDTVDASALGNWTNNNGAGIGTINGQLGGNDGGDLNLYGDFLGDIALLRFYRNQVLTDIEVAGNFDAIATPEPGTALLVALGLIGLTVTSRMRRR